MTAPPSCRCCGSPGTFVWGAKRGKSISQEYTYLKCRTCDFLFVDPVTDFGIYNDAYYRGHGPDPLVDYEPEYHDYRRTDRRHEFHDLFRLIAQILPSSPTDRIVRWLDYGCGAGGFLQFLRQQKTLPSKSGHRLIEPSGHDVGSYADRLKQHDGFNILSREALVSEPPESYDVISMIEVLEHIPQPSEPIELAARLLRPGGVLAVTTGNLASPAATKQGLEFPYCIPEIHVSLFSPTCLSALYSRFGLRPKTVRYRGVITFKVLKSLPHPLRPLARLGLIVPPLRTWIDRRYGVSAMPWAQKITSSHKLAATSDAPIARRRF